MGFNAANIIAGPARIFIGTYSGVVLPVTGLPPTLFAHTAGVPSGLQTGFTEVGYTSGPVNFDYKSTKVEINPEQSFMPVDVFCSDEMTKVSFTALERTYAALRAAFDSVGQVSDSNKDLYYFGNGTSIITPSVFGVFFSHCHRDNGNKYTYACVYRAYNAEGVKLAFEKKKETSYAVTLTGLADTTRTAGDQGGQFVNEK